MKQKNNLMFFITILIPLFISIGFASWIIIYTIEFETKYENQPTSELFDFKQSVVYNSQEQVPSPKAGINLSDYGIDDNEISYKYKLTTDLKYTDGKPVNAGTYDVVLTINGSNNQLYDGSCKIQFTINKKKIKFQTPIVNINYNDCAPTWQDMSAYIEKQIVFTDENNVVATELYKGEYIFNGMNNGVYYYGTAVTGLSTTTNVAGSTYKATVPLHSDIADNYEFISGNNLLIKYKTVLCDNKYFTIEDAITSGSSTITLLGGQYDADSPTYIETCFSKILDTTEYTLYNRTLRVPFSNTTDNIIRGYTGVVATVDNVYSVLKIPKGIKFNLSGSKCFVGGTIYHRGVTYERGVVINNGEITLDDSSEWHSYGYTNGNGLINVKAGCELVEVIFLNDWPGGLDTITLASKKVFPVLKWMCANVSCKSYIYSGGRLNSVSYIRIDSLGRDVNVDDVYLIGDTDTPNCLFRPGSLAKTDDYILKHTKISDGDTNYNVKNQTYGSYYTNFEIAGSYIDGQVKIEAMGSSFITSTETAIPFTYSNLYIRKGAHLTISQTSILLYESTNSCELEEGAVLELNNSSAYVCCNGTTVIKINGTLKGTGYIGGKITTDKLNASIQSVKFIVPASWKSGSNSVTNQEIKAVGPIYLNGETSLEGEFQNGYCYKSISYGGKYYFEGSDAVFTYKVNYQISGHTGSGLVQTDNIAETETSEFVAFDSKYSLAYSTLNSASKLYYVFEGWYTDAACQNKFNGTEMIPNSETKIAEITLYAKWSLKNFSFKYSYGYEDASGNKTDVTNIVSESNKNTSFTREQILLGDIVITTNANLTIDGSSKFFKGWYIGFDDTVLIGESLSENVLELYLENLNATEISLYGKFVDGSSYTISFIDNVDVTGVTNPEDETELQLQDAIPFSSTFKTAITNNVNDNKKYENYFKYWSIYSNDTEGKYVISEGATIEDLLSIIGSYNEDYPNNKIETDNIYKFILYGILGKKYKVTYYNNNTTDAASIGEYYYRPDQDCYAIDGSSVPDIKPKPINGVQTTKTFVKWIYTIGSETKECEPDNKISLTGDLDIYPDFEVSETSYQVSWTETRSTVTVTNLSTNQSIMNGDYISSGTKLKVEATPTYESITSSTISINGGTAESITLPHEFNIDGVVSIVVVGSEDNCIPSGTYIFLADGTSKQIQYISKNDSILVFNHETGKLESSPILFIEFDGWADYELINLEFSNGVVTRLIYEHGYFNKTLNKYIYINNDNYKDYIGDLFMYYNGHNFEEVVLQDAYVTTEYVGCYSPVTTYHLNFFSDGMLSMPGGIEGLFNIFDYDEELRYDVEKMEIDIDTYGLFNYDVFKDYMPFEVYEMLPAKYMSIAIGKGMITFDDILSYIKKYLVNNEVV
mgnify:CR=1 FL=1